MTREKFAKIQEWGERFTIFGTPVYQEFLAGKRELTCTAWAIPTRNIKGWKAPCYLMTDGHYAALPGNARQGGLEQIRRGERRGARPALRELHGPLRLRSQRRARHAITSAATTGRISNTTSAPSPSRIYAGRKVNAFNGVLHRQRPSRRSQGRDQSPAWPGAQIRLPEQRQQRRWRAAACGSGDTSQRDELLAKIRAAKKILGPSGASTVPMSQIFELNEDTFSFSSEL